MSVSPENLASSQQLPLKGGGGSGCWRFPTSHSPNPTGLRVVISGRHICGSLRVQLDT